MFCPNCGQQIPDNVKFCPACGGSAISVQTPQQPNQPQMSQPAASVYPQTTYYQQQPQSVDYQQVQHPQYTQQMPYGQPCQQAQPQYADPSVMQGGNPSILKRYLFPRGFSQWAFLFCLVFLIYMLLSDYSDKGGMSFILGIGVILCALPTLIGIGRMNKNLKMLNESGFLNICAADYANARKTLRNHIAFGDQWLFGLGTGNMVRYEDITQIYRHKATVNWIFKVYDVLEVKLANGKSFTICRVPLFHKKDELQEVFRVVNSKNPYAKLGI